MDQENLIMDGELDDGTLSVLQASKFKNLSREYFQNDISIEPDPLKSLKDSSKFFSFQLPEDRNELFFRCEEAPLFWLSKSPLITQLENIYKSFTLSSGPNSYKSIKEFYSKWIIIKPENEKKYFAASVLNAAERKTGKSNFLIAILQAIILGYDKLLFNPAKALEILEKSKEVLNEGKLSESCKVDLGYLINLYLGFVHLNQLDLSNAKIKFAEALAFKPAGITARFYQVYADVQLNQTGVPVELISELYNYDQLRLEFAVETNDYSMFEYFLKFPVTVNLFHHSEFAPSIDIITDFFDSIKSGSEIDLKTLKTKTNTFKDFNLNEYYNEKVIQDLEFLDKIIPNFVESKNLLLCGAMVRLREKLGKVIESVIDVIKQKYYKVVKERLNLFDRELQDKFNEIQNLTKSFDDQKIKYKEKLENTLTLIGRKAAENIAILEERIKNLLFIQSLNPKTTFKNAMTYNFILSFTVFLMGGCAGYSNSFIGEPGKMNDLITVILVSGLKWGIIAFFVGLIISIVAAGLAFIEGVNQKQRLVQTINAIKEERDYEIDYYKKDLERNLKDSEDRFNKAIEEQKKHINDLKSEREKQEKVFKEEAEQRIHEEAKHLRALLES